MNTMKKLVVNGLWLAFGWLVAAGLCGSVWAEPEQVGDYQFDKETGTITGYEGAGGDVEIPAQIGGVTVKIIDSGAFCNRDLKSVTIPAGVTEIRNGAFSINIDLLEVTILAENPPTIGDNLFYGCFQYLLIRVPTGRVGAYKAAPGWGDYANKIMDGTGTKVKALAFDATLAFDTAAGEGVAATITPTEETLGTGEVWFWAVRDSDGENSEEDAAAKAFWNVLNAAIERSEVGMLNLLQITNELDGAFFGTSTATPSYEFHNASIETDFQFYNYVFARVRESDGAILSVGGVRKVQVRQRTTHESFRNVMLGIMPIKVDYYAWDGTQLAMYSTNAIPLTDYMTKFADGEWYVAAGKEDITVGVACTGSVHLILLEEADWGIPLVCGEGDATLSVHADRIYGAYEGPNLRSTIGNAPNLTLNVQGAIVNDGDSVRLKNLNLYGGEFRVISVTGDAVEGFTGERAALSVTDTLNVYGGCLDVYANDVPGCAGLGGDAGAPGCKVNIYGGMVTAFGGEGAPGIGAGAGCTDHGKLTIASGLHVWVAEESDGRKHEVSDYAASRERFVWVTPADDLIHPQDFTVKKTGEGAYKVTLPDGEDPNSTWAVLGVTTDATATDIGSLILGEDVYFPLGELMWLELIGNVEGGTTLVGDMLFADFAESFSVFVEFGLMSADDYSIQYKTGLEFTLDMPELDMLFIAKVTDDDRHTLTTLGGAHNISTLEVTEETENEIDDGTVSTPYYAWDGEKVAGPFKRNAIPVTADMETLECGWYVVTGEVTMAHALIINGDAHLILEDGASLKISTDNQDECPPVWYHQLEGGVAVSLSVYGQAEGTGTLTADATQAGGCSAIGNGPDEAFNGNFNLHGGKVIASASMGAAGIGSSMEGYSCIVGEGWFDGFAVNVYGGRLTVEAGLCGAGIGCGARSAGPRCSVNVLGGEVFASGSDINDIESGAWTPAIGWGYQTEPMAPHADCALTLGDGMAIWAGNDNSSGDFSGLSLTTAEDYCKGSPRLMYAHIAKAVAPEGDWAKLQKALTNDASSALTCDAFEHTFENGTNFVKLLKDVVANTDVDTCLVIASGSRAVLDLNGKSLDRGLGEEDGASDDGCVISVIGHLIVTDTSEAHDGKITGGFGSHVGGVLVSDERYNVTDSSLDQVSPGAEYARFVLVDGSIAANRGALEQDQSIGGVCVKRGGEFLMLGGRVVNNVGDLAGGVGFPGEVAQRGMTPCRVDLRGGIIAGNTGNVSGAVGSLAIGNEYELFCIGGTVAITNNAAVQGFGGVFSCLGLTLGGAPIIKDNKSVTANGQGLIAITAEVDTSAMPVESATEPLAEGAEIWVNALADFEFNQAEPPVKFLENASETSAQYFHSEIPNTQVSYNEGALWIVGASAAEGSPENPWKVGAEGAEESVLACTNGNGSVFVKGTGTPKTYGEGAEPWVGAQPPIAQIIVPRGRGDDFKAAWPALAGLIKEVPNYLAFTAGESGANIYLSGTGSSEDPLLETAFDAMGPWTPLAINGEMSEFIEMWGGQTVYFRRRVSNPAETLNPSGGRWKFNFEGTVEATGNIMSLLDKTCQKTGVGEHAFEGLFSSAEGLTSAPELPATTLSESCYQEMFADCSALTNAPALPANKLAKWCYAGMFTRCASLARAPELSATSLSSIQCCATMFVDAEKLNAVTVAFKTWNDETGGTDAWLANVAVDGVFTCPIELPVITDASHIPVGWVVKKRFTLPGPTAAGRYVVSNETSEAVLVEPVGSEPGSDEYEVTVGDTIKIYMLPAEGYEIGGKHPLKLNLTEGVNLKADLPWAVRPIPYQAWDEANKVMTNAVCTEKYEYVTPGTRELRSGWYVVQGNVNNPDVTILNPGVTILGDVHLILCDDAEWAVNGSKGGFVVSAGRSLTIYGQADGTGKLFAQGGGYSAGIGGGEKSSGTITINGGQVTAQGGFFAAGIGGGANSGTGGTVTINGGMVLAISNDVEEDVIGGGGAGIGGGAMSAGGAVTINGGEVTAISYPVNDGGALYYAEGIGAGAMGGDSGTLDLSGYAGKYYIYAGMDVTGVEAEEVQAGDFATWHTNLYVQITTTPREKPAAEGSPEKPWSVGIDGNFLPQAHTNGNGGVIVTGEGLPKPYGEGDPAPWADADPEIETIYVPQNTEDIYKHQWPDDADKIVGVPDYLSFTAKDGDVKISFGKTYAETYGLEYSFDPIADEWATLPEFDLNGSADDSDKVLIPNGQTLYIRKTGDAVMRSLGDAGKPCTFKMEKFGNDTATVEAGGNVMSLLDQTCRSKEVGDYAFPLLFSYCNILTTAPKLPATKLGVDCYASMFYSCSALEVAPELPATELAYSCYYQMFTYCEKLKSAPELPARELEPRCYLNMFFYCLQLNYIKVGFDVWTTDDALENWLGSVAETGTFVCSQALENNLTNQKLDYGPNTIPEGWRVARDYLSFTAKGGKIELTLNKVGNPIDAAFEFFDPVGNRWNSYGVDAETGVGMPIIIEEGQTVYFRKQGSDVPAVSTGTEDYWKFSFDGEEGATVAAGGNVMSLLDQTCQSRMIGEYGLYYLFLGCDRLVSAPRVDADAVMNYGCDGMFYGCTSLTTAPVIGGGDKFESYAFCSMFRNAGALNEMTVGFTEWNGDYPTYYWVENVAPFGVFRCPSELPIVVDRDHIPVGWIVFKKFSIPVIEGLEHSVTNSAGEVIVPCAVSQDGTKTYEVLAGEEETYAVDFWDVDGYPAVGKVPLDLGNLSDSVEIGSDKYPLPERGVQLTVKGAPEHSKFTIYCGEEVFAEGGADDLTTRVPASVTTKVVYSTTDDGWAYEFAGGQPVTEKVQLERQVTDPTEVSAPTEQPDNYQQVNEAADLFDEAVNAFIDSLTSYPPVVKNEANEKQEVLQAEVKTIRENPLPSSEALAKLENMKTDFDAWCAQLKKDADEFVAALKEAEEKTKAAGAELTKLGPTKYYEEKGVALIKTAQADVDKIKTDGKPPVKDQTANLQNAMKKFDADFEMLTAEIAAFKQAKAAATAKLELVQKNNDELLKIPEIAYRWGKMEASKDPAVQNYVGDIVFSKMDLGKGLTIMRSELDAAQNTDDVSKISDDTVKASNTLEDIRTRILSYQIPEYTLTVNVVHPYLVSYSVYTGETAQVAIVEKLSQTAEFHFVYETPVKVVYYLTDDWYAFDEATSKTVREFVALDAINEMMQYDRKVDEPALGSLKDLVGTYDGVKGQFAAWEKDAEQMSEELKEQIRGYIEEARAKVEALYAIGVPVGGTCEKINDCKDDVWSKIEPLFKQGYLQLAAERGNEFKNKYSQFLDENAERINEIKQYGTPESDALITQVDQLKNNCEDLIKQIDSGSIDNKTAYEALLSGKQKLEDEMDELAKQLSEAIRYVAALPVSAERDFNGSVIVRSTQSRITGEQSWLCLWFPKYLEGDAIWRAEQIIGRKFREIPAEELYQWCGGDCIIMNYGDQMLGNLYPPEKMTAFVIVAIDDQGMISRVGGVGGLDALAPGEVKGADIACGGAMNISYFESQEGELFQNTVMALPITSGGEVTLDAGVSGYYAVLGDCEITSLIVEGDVTLILGRGCDLSVLDGIVLGEAATLRICSEHYFLYEPYLTGRMTVAKTGVDTTRPAAIYGQVNRSWLEIHGGVIDVSSATAGIGVGQFRMANGDVTVTGGESYAGIYLDSKAKAQCRVEAGTLNVTGGAGAAAIGGNAGQSTDNGDVTVTGGLVRADATPTEDGKCGDSIGAAAGGKTASPIKFGQNLSIFTAENVTSKMKLTDAKFYNKRRSPSVLITTSAALIQPLPFTLTKNDFYNLQMPGNPSSQYVVFALTKDDLARAYGEGSTVGAEIWRMVSQIGAGGRVAVGEITRASLMRSLYEMGVKTIYTGYSSENVCNLSTYEDIAMIVVVDCDAQTEQGQVVRLGGIHVPDSMTYGSSIESAIGREAIGALTFQVIGEDGKIKLQNLSEEPNEDEGEKFMLCCYTKEKLAAKGVTEEALAAAAVGYIGREVGTAPVYFFSDMADYKSSDREFDQGLYTAVFALITDSKSNVRRIGVVTGIGAMTDGQSKDSETALIGAQSFTVRADNSDRATILMPGMAPQSQAWLWARVSDETKYEALDTFINGLIGQPVGAEGATLRPLDATAIPAMFGSGNWGIFTGDSVEIRRYDAKTGNSMRGVMVFKVATLPISETGNEMMILTVGGVKNVDKLMPGQELSNQYGEDVEHIVNQPFTVTRQSEVAQLSLLVEPQGGLPEGGSWCYLTIDQKSKIDLALDDRLLIYLGAAVGDLTLNTLWNWGYWPSSTTESSFTVPSDTEAVYLFMVDANGAILTIGRANELSQLYEPGMWKGDTFGKTFVAAQDFGVTRAGDALTASVSAQDAFMAEQSRDRFICFTYDDPKTSEWFYKAILPGALGGTTEVGALKLASLGKGDQPKVLGTFTTDELSVELPADCTTVFVARVHGADDTIVTLGGVMTDGIADGAMQRPDVGFSRIRPFDFTVAREKDDTFTLTTQSARRQNEQWLWVAVPPHVRYVMEQRFESSECLLEQLRREMVEMGAGSESSKGKSEFIDPKSLQLMLGEGYYDTSLQDQLYIEQIPADTEVVMVFKLDRATGRLCGEGAVIGLDQLAAGEKKQNQINGKINYVEVDAGGNRTLKEATVEPITDLTTSIGGGRWYVLTALQMSVGELDVIKRIPVNGEANLILLDSGMSENAKFSGAVLNGGFAVNEGATLNIYGQQAGNGVLQVAGADDCAAIGGDADCGCGTINIHGGFVMAEAGAGAAAIGGGYMNGDKNGSVNLYGGLVMARAGDAAAIGGGQFGRGCNVCIYPAATLFCVNEGDEETVGVGGCNGLENGAVAVSGENRVYLEADEAFTPHPYGYYFGDVRHSNFIATELLTVSLPKDERLQYHVESLMLGGDVDGVLPGDDAYTYRVLRGDTIVVTAKTIGMDGGVNYNFHGPNVFKFDCVQSDVTLSADDLKVAQVRGVTPMDFTVSRDKFGQLSLRVNETFAPGEQLVWGVVPEGAKPPMDDPTAAQMFTDPVSAINMLLGQGLSIGDLCCDTYAMILGAKNWNIVFDYAGEEIPLPENAVHVMAFKVYDAGRYAALAASGKKTLQAKKTSGRLALIKVGAIDDVFQIQPGTPRHNQVDDGILIARQPFALTRNGDGTFQLAMVGQLDAGRGEKWGLVTINSEGVAMIESGAIKGLTLDLLKAMLDGMIGRCIGTVTMNNLKQFAVLSDTFDTSVYTCPADTAVVVAFKLRPDKKGDIVCTLGYTFDDLQAMSPGGTERKGNEIDGETDAPTYFVTIENIPEGVEEVALTYAFGDDGMSVYLSSAVSAERTAQFAVPEGVDVKVNFREPNGMIFRTKNSVSIKAIHQDEVVDASFLILTARGLIEPQDFNLQRNGEKAFLLEMPEYGLDVDKGDRWFYFALNAQDIAMSLSGDSVGAVVWLLANSMLGQEVGSSDKVTTAYFMNALRTGYTGYTTERFVGLPADAEMVFVCKCFDVTAEDGFTTTYVETVGGCRTLQQMGEYETRGDEMNYPSGGDAYKTDYQKWDKTKSAFVSGETVVARVIDDDTTTIGNGEWYVVPPMEEVTCGTITVQGTANVIVGDMATFELDNFVVEAGATLNVYGQSQRLGTLIVGGDGVSIGSDTACGTINLHGVTVMVESYMVGIGGMSEGGELNVLGANMLVMAYGPAIAGCTVNAYGGRVLAASMSGGDYPAINDGLAIKNSKMGLFASANPAALEPTKVADYLADRKPFAKIVEQVNIILPKVEHVKVSVTARDVATGGLIHFEPEDLPGADGLVYKVERFDNVTVNIKAAINYQLRSPAEYLFDSIDSDKQLAIDAIVVKSATPSQMIERQPFSVYRTMDENGPCCELKPIGELGPGERWFWMSCDRTLAQMADTIMDDMTTEEAICALLNQAIGQAPVGYLSLDQYGLRTQLPVNQSGVGTDATFRLPADTDLVLLSKVYDGGLQDEGMVRYFNITLGLSTNLTARMEGGDSGHNDVGEEPTEEEIKNALEDAFPDPHKVTQNEDGTFRVTLMEDMTGPVAIPDNLGEIVLDMNGFHITGTNGFNGADGGNALVFTDSGDVGSTTGLTIVEAGEKYNPEGDIVGGNGADGKKPGKGGAAIRVDTKRGVTINVEGTVLVIGGNGGTLLDGDKGTKPGDPGRGIDPQNTRGDRAPGSVDEGEWGEELSPWAKAALAAEAPDNLQTRLPEGVTAVGNELWFWKRTGEGAIGFDFRTIEMNWLDDRTIRFAAGTYLVDQFTYGEDGEIVFVGADSAAVVVEDAPFGPVKPEEKPDKPVVKAVVVGNKGPELPDLGKYTVLVSTGKSIFKSTSSALMAVGPLMKKTSGPYRWRNLGFTALPGTAIEGNGGAICVANVYALTVEDCAFAGLMAGQMGGAIYAAGLTAGMITNSTFTACSVSDENGLGGAIYAVGGTAPFQAVGPLGGPALKTPKLTVVDCAFTLNDAQSGGAICTTPMYEDEELIELVIAGTTFGGNTADYNGGAICACGKVTIADAADGLGTLFMQNRAGVYGGALAIDGVEEDVFNSMVSVGSNTVFACNTVENDWLDKASGGAINLPTNCLLTVRNALFTNNVAVCSGENVYGVYGGAISTADGCLKYIEKTAFIDNAAIIENAMTGNRYAAGGALSECGGVTLIDTCVFDGNTVEGEAAVGAALDLEYDEEATVLNSTFRNSNWEAVSVYDASAVIRNCVIVGNSVGEKWYDVYLDVGDVELTFSAFGNYYQAPAAVLVSSNNIAGVTAAQVYDGETLLLATNVYNAVAALGYPQPGVTDFNGVEYGSTFWGTSMGAFETPAIYPVEQLGFEITVEPQELAWTGLKVHPTSIAVTNPLTRAELTEGVDYEISYENDTDATDQARVVVTGIGNYTGVATTNYWITSYLVRYYACEGGLGSEVVNPLEQVELGSLNGSNVVAKIAPPAGYAFDPFHVGTLTNGTVSLYDSEAEGEVGGRLVLNVFYAKSSGGDDDVPDKYQRRITYKVANGWWDGDEKNGADKSVWVTLYDGEGNWSENGTGTLSGIPAVGNEPFSGYAKAGVWYPAQPTTVEMPITRTSPAQPFFLYVYCPQPEGGSGRAGRGGTATVTQADLDALKGHLQTKFNLKSFSAMGPNITGVIEVGVVDQTTGHLLASDLLESAKVLVKSTPDLTSDEWSTDEVPTDGKGQFSFPKPEGEIQLFLQVESAEK